MATHHLNRAFRLLLNLRRDEPRVIVDVFNDMGYDNRGAIRIRCEVRQGGKVIFPSTRENPGQLFGAIPPLPPGASTNGIVAREMALAIVGMRPGDVDEEYFAGYTEEQKAWVEKYGEAISSEREYRYCDKDGNPKS